MSFSWKKAVTIAEREYLTTVRRKAFLFTVIGTPVLYAILMTLMIRPQMGDRARQMRDFKALGVVDSSGAFADAESEILGTVASDISMVAAQVTKRDSFRVDVRMIPDQPEGERALRAGEINQLLVVPADYLEGRSYYLGVRSIRQNCCRWAWEDLQPVLTDWVDRLDPILWGGIPDIQRFAQLSRAQIVRDSLPIPPAS